MNREFDGKVAFVTGAAGGIGRSSALAFAARGASVVVCDLVDPSGTAAEAAEHGVEVRSLQVDVGDAAAVRDAVAAAVEAFGRLDFAHNNAGTFSPAPMADLGEDDWHRVISVNLSGVFVGMKYQIPHLLETGGAIVNTASIWCEQGSAAQAAYVASKHGVAGLTRTAAIDYGGRGIRINAVAPGVTVTDMTDDLVDSEEGRRRLRDFALGRFGRPEEVADLMIFLLSDASALFTGQTLNPNAGGYMP